MPENADALRALWQPILGDSALLGNVALVKMITDVRSALREYRTNAGDRPVNEADATAELAEVIYPYMVKFNAEAEVQRGETPRQYGKIWQNTLKIILAHTTYKSRYDVVIGN